MKKMFFILSLCNRGTLFLYILFLLCSKTSFGQIYVDNERPRLTSSMRPLCLVEYKIGKDGYYHPENYSDPQVIMADDYQKTIKGKEHFFCYSKDAKRYYFYNENMIGYYFTTDNKKEKELISTLKKHNVKNINVKEFPSYFEEVKKQMDDYYNKKNDSIAEVKKKLREQQIQDSIASVQKKFEELDEYRKEHDWHELDLGEGVLMRCRFCDELHRNQNLYVISINSDTIYYLREEPVLVMLGKVHNAIHFNEITNELRKNKKFTEYVEIWRDSIANNNDILSNLDVAKINLIRYLQFKDEITKVAPYGYIKDWGWYLNSANGIESHFSFFNTFNKTIKYVDFYFSVFNAVGDRCALKYSKSPIGNVRGVGPVEPFESGSWSWDRATHYTSGDASEMRINKLVITYMDGTTKTILSNSIVYDGN